jgi:hypothetical protein
MSIENPWFATRFSREDFATVARLRYGRPYRDRHFEPLLLDPKGAVGSSSWQLRIQGCSGVHDAVKFSRVELMTARWAFLVSALGQVFAETKRQFPDMDDVRWVPCLPNWRELVLPDSHVEAGAFAEERLRAICAGRNLLVDTGVRIQPDEASTEFNLTGEARTTIRVVLDVEQLTDEVAHSITEQCWARTGHIEVPTGRRWFPWEHVEEFLYRPSRLDLELLNHWEATPRATELEKRMIRQNMRARSRRKSRPALGSYT